MPITRKPHPPQVPRGLGTTFSLAPASGDVTHPSSSALTPDANTEALLLSLIRSYRFDLLPTLAWMEQGRHPLSSWLLWLYVQRQDPLGSIDPQLKDRLRQRSCTDPSEGDALRIFCRQRINEHEESPCASAFGLSAGKPQVLRSLTLAHLSSLHARQGRWQKAAAILPQLTAEAEDEWLGIQALLRIIFLLRAQELSFPDTIDELDRIDPLINPRFMLCRFHLNLLRAYLSYATGRSSQLMDNIDWPGMASILPPAHRPGYSLLRNWLSGSHPELLKHLWSLDPPELKTQHFDPIRRAHSLAPSAWWLDEALNTIKAIQSWKKPQPSAPSWSMVKRLEDHNAQVFLARLKVQSLLIEMQNRSDRLETERTQASLRAMTLSAHAWRSSLAMIEAADRYRSGDFRSCIDHLIEARRSASCKDLQAILELWLATADGRVARPLEPYLWIRAQSLARLLFAPHLVHLGRGQYQISHHYKVDLTRHPVLHRLLRALLQEHEGGLPAATLQKLVWRQSTSLEGWKQKIRNTIQRLRLHFRFTLVPIVMQEDGLIRLNHQALAISTAFFPRRREREKEILRLLERGPLSSRSLASRTKIPLSTVKKLLQQLTTQDRVQKLQAEQKITYCLHGTQAVRVDRLGERADSSC